MKTLILLRHAKSSWARADLADFDRPLNARGRTASPRVGRALALAGYAPALVLCSAACRTRETLALVLPAFAAQTRIEIEADLYAAEAGRLLARLRRVPPSVPSVLLVAHNPGLEDLAELLVRDGPDEARRRMARKFPTAAFAAIALEIGSWRELEPASGRLERFEAPDRAEG